MHRMKKTLCMMMAAAAAVGSMARGEVWSLRMPQTGLLPSYAKATYLTRMHERHGGSHMGMQDYTLNIPFVDGRRSHVGSWWYNVQGNATATLMDVGGSLDLRRDALFDFAIPVTLIHPLPKNRRLMLTAMPHYAGDGVHSAHAWDLSAVVDYAVKYSDTFAYSVGVAASPRFAQYAAVPYFFFSWNATQDWTVRLQGYQLTALYAVTERLRVGPSLSGEGGSWMVARPEGQRILRVRSLMAAMVAEYNFAAPGQSKRLFTASLGSTLATTAEICNRTARKESIETHHYKPGLAFSLEVDFRF